MSRKKVFTSTIVNESTGEIISCKSTYVSSALERFGMFRTTEGVRWILGLSECEIKILILFHEWSDDMGCVSFTPVKRDFALNEIRTGKTTLSKAVSGLIDKGCLLRTGRFDFVINPATLFKGSSRDLRAKIDAFEELKKNIYEIYS